MNFNRIGIVLAGKNIDRDRDKGEEREREREGVREFLGRPIHLILSGL